MIDRSTDRHTDRQVGFLGEFVNNNLRVAGDVVEISANTWAIHGIIPVDGDVIVAEFGTYAEARDALNSISADQLERTTVPALGLDEVSSVVNGVVP